MDPGLEMRYQGRLAQDLDSHFSIIIRVLIVESIFEHSPKLLLYSGVVLVSLQACGTHRRQQGNVALLRMAAQGMVYCKIMSKGKITAYRQHLD